MAATLTRPPLKKWTREEFDVLDAAGLLAGTRFELIEGEVFDQMGQNPRHAALVSRLAAFLGEIFGPRRIRSQASVEAASDERDVSLPEPDVAVTRETDVAYTRRHPDAGDVLLLGEVTDTTQYHDLTRKAGLYARAGFSEYIVADLKAQQLIVHREPVDGAYSSIQALLPGQQFHPLASPESSIPVSDILGV